MVRHPSWPALATWSRLRDNEIYCAYNSSDFEESGPTNERRRIRKKAGNGFCFLRKLCEIRAAGRLRHRGGRTGAVTGARGRRRSERLAELKKSFLKSQHGWGLRQCN